MIEIDTLHAQIRECRACVNDGFPISPPPMVWGSAPAPVMVIGQAPGLSDLRGERMYLGPAARKLFGWLRQAGFTDPDFGTVVYMTALTKCFPGRLPGKSTDRAPSARERANCRPWLNRQIDLVQPKLVILFGKMAIDTFLPPMSLEEAVGRPFERDGRVWISLPHSSGASTWLNDPAHRAQVDLCLERISELREKVAPSMPHAEGGAGIWE